MFIMTDKTGATKREPQEMASKNKRTAIIVSSAKHRHNDTTLKKMAKYLIYGKLRRHTNQVLLRFLKRDSIHEVFCSISSLHNSNNNYSFLPHNPK